MDNGPCTVLSLVISFINSPSIRLREYDLRRVSYIFSKDFVCSCFSGFGLALSREGPWWSFVQWAVHHSWWTARNGREKRKYIL